MDIPTALSAWVLPSSSDEVLVSVCSLASRPCWFLWFVSYHLGLMVLAGFHSVFSIKSAWEGSKGNRHLGQSPCGGAAGLGGSACSVGSWPVLSQSWCA